MAIISINNAEDQTLQQFSNVTGSIAVASNVAKTGTYSYRANPTTSSTGYMGISGFPLNDVIYYGSNPNLSEVELYVSFDMYITTLPSTASTYESVANFARGGAATQALLRLYDDGSLDAFYNTTGTDRSTVTDAGYTLSTGTWYRVDWYWNSNSGATVVRVDGVEWINDSTDSDGAPIGFLEIGKVVNSNSETIDINYDNIVISSTAFADTSAVVATLVPTADGTLNDFSGDYTDLNTFPPNDATERQSNTGATDEDITHPMTSTSSAGVSGTISALQITGWATKITGANSQISALIYTGSTTYVSTGAFLVNRVTVRTFGEIREQDPSTSAVWTTSGIDAAEFGVRKPSSTSNGLGVHALYVNVLYVPGGGPSTTVPIFTHHYNTMRAV